MIRNSLFDIRFVREMSWPIKLALMGMEAYQIQLLAKWRIDCVYWSLSGSALKRVFFVSVFGVLWVFGPFL